MEKQASIRRFSKMGDGRWAKGQSGNLNGRPRKLSFDDFLREALLAKDAQVAKRLVERLIGDAAAGNVLAMKLIAERTGGKPQNPEDIALKNGDELTLAQVRKQLAELLNRPGVRESLKSMLAGADEPKEAVQ
jgi:hypothetical protein